MLSRRQLLRADFSGRRPTQSPPGQVKAVVKPECLTRHGVVCRSCGEQCETGAIRFHFIKGGVAQPQVEPALCTGCGACFAVCPAQAIALHDDPVYQEACT
jgi:ferredoxin-type protein NapF